MKYKYRVLNKIDLTKGKYSIKAWLGAIAATIFVSGCENHAACEMKMAQFVKSQTDIKSYEAAIQMYQLDHGHFPESLSTLSPKYVTTIRKDAWEQDYQYDPGVSLELAVFSLGPGSDDGTGGQGVKIYSNSDRDAYKALLVAEGLSCK